MNFFQFNTLYIQHMRRNKKNMLQYIERILKEKFDQLYLIQKQYVLNFF